MNLNSSHYIGGALVAAALLPLSHGAQLYGAQNMYMQNSAQRNATVVNHVYRTQPIASKPYPEVYLVVEYVNDDGMRSIAKTNVSSYPASHTMGEPLTVRVHHTDPGDVRLDSFAGLWLESAFYLLPGLLTLALGLVLIFRKPKARTT